MTELGLFKEGFNSFRRMMAGAAIGNRMPVFINVVGEAAGYVVKGLDRTVCADELFDIAAANGLNDADAVQDVMTRAFGKIDDNVERVPDPQPSNGKGNGPKPNGHSGALNVWNAGRDLGLPPPRQWLLGNSYCRGFTSSLQGAGGIGKSALRCLQALALATGRELTGEHVFKRTRVLIVSLEDDTDELRRRVLAARLHHNIPAQELDGWLFLSAPGGSAGKLITANPKTGAVVVGELAAKLEAAITEFDVGLLVLDPLIKTHSVSENDNNAMDAVMEAVTDLAVKHNIAVDVPHHTGKGIPDPGNADKGRGASAFVAAARLVWTFCSMSTEEAKLFGVLETERRAFVRLDRGKINLAASTGAAIWFRLVGVPLGNASEDYPSGDNIQTVEPWSPPGVWDGFAEPLINQILDVIEAGCGNGNFYTAGPHAAPERAAWTVIVQCVPDKTEAQAREIIKAWVKSGLLVVFEYENPATRKTVKGLKIDPTKRPGTAS